MARVSYIEPQNAPLEVQEIYDKVLKGKPGNIQKALAHQPKLLETFLPFYGSIGRSLGRRLYEMVYIRIAFINGCQYCLKHHLAASTRAGLTAEDWQALKNPEASNFSDKEKAALRYAEKMTRGPTSSAGTEADALKKYFSDAEIVDLVAEVALVNFTNRVTDGLGLEVEPEFANEKI
jgi:uncharacterized peroxidase-related enzyme